MGVPRLEDLLAAYAARKEALEKYGAYFLGDINQEEAENFSKALLLMGIIRQNLPDEERKISIYINSGGDSFGAGLAMIEMMSRVKRDFGLSINTVITGYAYSMGAIVFEAGDNRSMGFLSTVMLHGGSWLLSGEDEKIFKDYLKLADHYREIVGHLFAQRTGLHDDKWWIKFIYSGRDRFLSAQECLELKLVDEVLPLGLPS